jgi:hypothetical protein
MDTQHTVTDLTSVVTPAPNAVSNKVNEPSSVISIGSSAMLTDLTIRVYSGRKKDKDATARLNSQNQASSNAALVTKRLLGHCPELIDIQKFAARVRNETHYALTLPWMDSGMRLIPTELYLEHKAKLDKHKVEFDDMVARFLNIYSTAIADARNQLGYLFNMDDYDSLERVANKFEFRAVWMMIPEPDGMSDDFRLRIGQQAADQLREHYSDAYDDAINQSMVSLWKRLHEALTNLSDKLDADGVAAGKRIHASKVDALHDLVDMLKSLNVAQDPQLEAMRIKLRQALRGVTPEALKEDDAFAAHTKSVLDDAIKSLPSLDI